MVMERVTLADAHDLEQIADDVCKEGAIIEDTTDVVSMCRACLGSPSVKQALELGSWWREVPFMLNHGPDGEDAGRAPLTNGRVDLVYRDGHELIVVDYKTDKDVTEHTAEQYARDHHAGQGEVYPSTATGLKVREVALVYCKAGAEVRLHGRDVVGTARLRRCAFDMTAERGSPRQHVFVPFRVPLIESRFPDGQLPPFKRVADE